MLRATLSLYDRIVSKLEVFAAPFALLAARLYIAKVFWDSGQVKISNMDLTIDLFYDEYEVPLLSPEFAAYSATAVELIVPVLLVAGLFTRFGALALIGMTIMIEISYGHFPDHNVWAVMLLTLLAFGGGTLSLDKLLRR